MADNETCYMAPLDANEEKPTQIKKLVEIVHGIFPPSSLTVQEQIFARTGEFDLNS